MNKKLLALYSIKFNHFAQQVPAAFADLMFDTPAEALDLRGGPKRGGRHLLGEGIEFEAVKGQEFFIHEGLASVEVGF
jgi:hypothetical protein